MVERRGNTFKDSDAGLWIQTQQNLPEQVGNPAVVLDYDNFQACSSESS